MADLVEQSVGRDVVVGDRLDAGDDVGPRVLAEEVGVAALDRQVRLDRRPVADGRHRR